MNRLAGRKAVVFGHTSGLGAAIADAVLSAGGDVVGIARRGRTPRIGDELTADLSDDSGIAAAVTFVRDAHADFDVLVYCAGSLIARPVSEIAMPGLLALYRLNLFAPMIIEGRLTDLIADRKATVVNITSSSVDEHYPLYAEYASSKAAFARFTAHLRQEVAQSGARVLDVCPSGFRSEMYERMEGEKVERDESIQMDPEDIAELVLHAITIPRGVHVTRLNIARGVVGS